MAEKKKTEAAAVETPKKKYVHVLLLSLVGGQQFQLNEVTDSTDMPMNVTAFINAWREKKDVWHSPGNDPHFGVRVMDVSMYRYQCLELKDEKAEVKPVEEAPAETAAEA